MRLVVVSIVGLCLAACEVSQEQRANDVCTAVCNCFTMVPAENEECVAECVDEAPPIPDACLDCVYTYSQTCGALLEQCFEEDQPCDIEQQQPPQP